MTINSYPQLLQFYKENLDDDCYLEIFNATKAFCESLTVRNLYDWLTDAEIKLPQKLNKEQLIIAAMQYEYIEDPEGDPEGLAQF